MSNLDDRIVAILKDYLRDNLDNWGHSGDKVDDYLAFHLPGYTKSVIKQAFIDEYWLMPKHPNTFPDPLVMTGPEWLARFEKEYPKVVMEDDHRLTAEDEAVLAARRASGLGDKDA